MKGILVKAKVQTIIFQALDDTLGFEYATSPKRITIAEAGDTLLDRGIEFKEVLKVKPEVLHLELPLEDLSTFTYTPTKKIEEEKGE